MKQIKVACISLAEAGDLRESIPGTVLMRCHRCNEHVCVSPSTLRMADGLDLLPYCMPCIDFVMQTEGRRAYPHLRKEQIEELNANGISTEDAQNALEQMAGIVVH